MASKTRIIDVPATGGTGVDILATRPVRRYIVRESIFKADGVTKNAAFQGFNVTDKTPANVPSGANGPKVQIPPSAAGVEPPKFVVPEESDASFHENHGIVIANGPSINIGVGVGAAQPLCNVESATAIGTSIEVVEIY
jgi:hypothetical protein